MWSVYVCFLKILNWCYLFTFIKVRSRYAIICFHFSDELKFWVYVIQESYKIVDFSSWFSAIKLKYRPHICNNIQYLWDVCFYQSLCFVFFDMIWKYFCHDVGIPWLICRFGYIIHYFITNSFLTYKISVNWTSQWIFVCSPRVLLSFNSSISIDIVSVIGILEYKLVMSNDTSFELVFIYICGFFIFMIKSWSFFML